MEWTKRETGDRETGRWGDGETQGDRGAPWAGVELAALSCLVQGINFVRNDIAPSLEATKQTSATLNQLKFDWKITSGAWQS